MKEFIDEDFDIFEDVSIYNLPSILNYIKNNFIKFLLLFLAIFIVFIVDHISNINNIIFSFPYPIPGLPNHSQSNILVPKLKKRKSNR